MSTQSAPDQKKCRLAEIVQYTCDVNTSSLGKAEVHCFPIPRIFKICPRRPAVEITKFVCINLDSGEVLVPPEAAQALPKGRPWRDVTRYKNDP